MNETPSLKLPLLRPSQAQKHVTVNEALVRIDGIAQLRLQSCSTDLPPGSIEEGSCYGVPLNAKGTWAGRDGNVAVASNGGWVFLMPSDGWSAWVVDRCERATYLQGNWQSNVLAASTNGAQSNFHIQALEYDILPGGTQEIPLEIPENSMVFACSARVVSDLTGDLVSWNLGLPGEVSKFGSGMGVAAGSYCTGILSQPTTYYSTVRPVLVPIGGNLTGGRLEIALHVYRVTLPS